MTRFVDQPVPPHGQWRSDKGPRGRTWRAYFTGIGLFTTDDAGQIVVNVVLSHRPDLVGPSLDHAALVSRARTFASAHVPQVDRLALFQTQQNDSGPESLFSATWREQRDQPWLPMLVSVTLTLDGRPVEFGYNPTSVGSIRTTPRIDSGTAAQGAQAAAGSRLALLGPPELDVIGPPQAKPRLVW